jgi:hypothetical protein
MRKNNKIIIINILKKKHKYLFKDIKFEEKKIT